MDEKVSRARSEKVIPFLKWAGGKRWFAHKYSGLIASDIGTYVEPFLGSGAVFFSLAPPRAILTDINRDLVETYRGVRDYPQRVESLLHFYQRNHSPEFYYKVRDSKPIDAAEKSAWFIYLNRTCWNGLYRVNRKGQFNVPVGTKTNVLLDSDDFLAVSDLLKTSQIEHQDFEVSIAQAEEGDFVFADPPYTVRHNYNGFVKYNEKLFSWDDQVRLRDSLLKAKHRGVRAVVTNANHKSIKDLYSGFDFIEVSRASTIAASGDRRGSYSELLINI